MYYLELIQRFWDFNQKAKVNTNTTAMYLYLLNLANKAQVYNLVVSDVIISEVLGITRKTVKASKENLRDLGLIKYENVSGLPCSYRLLLNYPLQIRKQEKPQKTNAPNNTQTRATDKTGNSQAVILPAQNVPKITEQKIEIPRNTSGHSMNIVDIPSLEEFMKYAKSLKDYDPELDLSLTRKYENWINNGWKNTSNRPISNWKSTLKSTLPYLKNSNEEYSISLQDIPNIKHPKISLDK